MTAKIRLYVEHPLGAGQSVPLNRDQAHYLFGVMRLGPDGEVLLFNGRDGEWLARIETATRHGGALIVGERTRPLLRPPDLWLIFAPIKKARTEFIVKKATEMGAARIVPVQTQFTNSERIRQDRLQAYAIEAAEQCGGTFVPEVAGLQPLARLLDRWPEGRRLMFCDEAAAGRSSALTGDFAVPSPGPWAILIGPEGGFSDAERAWLRALPFTRVIGLGPRILRADTAAVAALALWQRQLGDWG